MLRTYFPTFLPNRRPGPLLLCVPLSLWCDGVGVGGAVSPPGKCQPLGHQNQPENVLSSRCPSTQSHSLITISSSEFSTNAAGSRFLDSASVRSTLGAVGRLFGSSFQQAMISSHNSSNIPCEGLFNGRSGRRPAVTLFTISSSLSFGNGILPVKI